MQIDVTFKQMPHSDALARYAEEKLGRILANLGEPVTAQVVLQVEKYRHLAKVTVSANHIVIKGKEETNDMYSSIDLVADKLERQVKKFHAKLVERKAGKGAPSREVRAQVRVIAESSASQPQPDVIKAKEVVLRPMTVEEAVMQMELLGKNFLLFNNASTRRVTLIFTRDDGNLGIIEPQLEE